MTRATHHMHAYDAYFVIDNRSATTVKFYTIQYTESGMHCVLAKIGHGLS